MGSDLSFSLIIIALTARQDSNRQMAEISPKLPPTANFNEHKKADLMQTGFFVFILYFSSKAFLNSERSELSTLPSLSQSTILIFLYGKGASVDKLAA